ncbi:hypothetical protein AB0I89_24045 [Micromonospora sp. NPDC049801]|uniref:hypothetical protein n=1 Tax=unclassified Micromonospora TaxID=2617518 RepID=UPI0033DD5152
MAKYRVYMETTASMTVTVEVDDNLSEDEAREAAIEKAYDEAPRDVCAQCSGWNQPWSLDLGEWEMSTESDGSEVQPELA